MKYLILILTSVLVLGASIAQDANLIIDQMIDKIGGKKAFYNLNNVTYDYEYTDPNSSTRLKGQETYAFDGELSHAKYTEHSLLGANGVVIEGYDGTNAWVKFNNKLSSDEKANGVARFLRKTNYYWFTMLFKLQDKGVNLSHIGTKSVDGKMYDLIKVTFGDKVGDAQDTYVLYINQKTKIVDQFLFTVVGFGVTEPNLMKLTYETIDGIKIPSERVYIASNWEGDVIGEKWTTTYWSNIKFDTKIDTSIFNK